ncbi:MAG TPA: MBL fold metallo-hydrolase [Chloroflexota bacterium]
MRLVVLGSGTSNGVPVIGCDCPVCRSPDPRDKRTRPSVLVQVGGSRVLVDTTPELRLQLVRENVPTVDAIVFTHEHADHIYGLDDVRVFSMRERRAVPVFGPARTLAAIRRSFAYIFAEGPSIGGGRPQLDLREVDGPFEPAPGVPFEPIPVWHGAMPVNAYRIGDLAYVTDVNRIDPGALDRLRNLDVLILDALRERPHPTHYSVAEALEVVAELKPARTYLTHICHDMGHADMDGKLPPGVELAYDGLAVELADPT